MKQTTTDFQENIAEILKEHEEHTPIYTCRLQIIGQILSALSELVEECKPKHYLIINGKKIVRTVENNEISQYEHNLLEALK